MGGVSTGNVSREIWDGKTANVLRGRVSLANNGGFIQMATNLVAAGSGGEQQQQTSVDASAFLGIELHVQSFKITSENNDDDSDSAHPDESFNVHLKNTACTKPYISYRATFVAPTGQWTTVRIPFASFQGKGQGVEGTSFDTKTLTRLGIVAIGRAMTVQLAVAEVRFYK